MKRLLLLSSVCFAVLTSSCASYESQVQAALRLPPEQCSEAMWDAWKSDGAWGIERPESTYEYNQAQCYKGKKGYETTYQVHMDEVAKKGGYRGNAATGSSGLDMSTIASTYAAGAAIGAATNRRGTTSSLPVPARASQTAVSTAGSQYVASASNRSTTTQQTTSTTPKRSYRTGTDCVRREQKSNSLADFWENHCSFPVWISWFSDGCKGGCAAGPIQPGAKDSTNKERGHIRFAACEYPATPKNADRSQWRGSTTVYCES